MSRCSSESPLKSKGKYSRKSVHPTECSTKRQRVKKRSNNIIKLKKKGLEKAVTMNFKKKRSTKPVNASTQVEIQPSIIKDEIADEEAFKYSRSIGEKISSNKATHENDLEEMEKVNLILFRRT